MNENASSPILTCARDFVQSVYDFRTPDAEDEDGECCPFGVIDYQRMEVLIRDLDEAIVAARRAGVA